MSLGFYYAAAGGVAFAFSSLLVYLARRQLDEVKRLLDEVCRANDEFAEGQALLKSGAVDEAIEVCSRAEKRRAQNA